MRHDRDASRKRGNRRFERFLCMHADHWMGTFAQWCGNGAIRRSDVLLHFTEHSLLSHYPNMRAECHWHIDFEFTYIMRGHMWYFVNGETIRLDEGQGIFVNSRQLHYGFTKDNAECEFSCTLLNPTRTGRAQCGIRTIHSADSDGFINAIYRVRCRQRIW